MENERWMEVKLTDGTTQRRRVANYDHLTGQYEPETFEGEEVLWTLASTMPLIVKI